MVSTSPSVSRCKRLRRQIPQIAPLISHSRAGGRAITRHVVTLAAYFQRIIPSSSVVVFFFWSISSLFIQRPQVILGELFDMSSQRRNPMISGGIIPSCIHLELTSPHRYSSTSHKLFGGSCARNATLPLPFTF